MADQKFSEFVRLPDLRDFWPGARRSARQELAATEHQLGITLPSRLKAVLLELGEIRCGDYLLAGTEAGSETSLTSINQAIRSDAPPGFVAIATRLDDGAPAFMGLWREHPSARWVLCEWAPERSAQDLAPTDPLEIFRQALIGHSAKKGHTHPQLPDGLHFRSRSPGAWLRDALEQPYSRGTPANWHDAAAWDRYYERRRQSEAGLVHRFNEPLLPMLESIPRDLPILLVGNGMSRDPIALANLGWHAIAVEIAQYPVARLQEREGIRQQEAQPGSPAAAGRVEAVRCDVFKYEPPGPCAAIVVSHFER